MEVDPRRNMTLAHDVVRQPHEGPGVERDALDRRRQRHPAAAESRPHARSAASRPIWSTGSARRGGSRAATSTTRQRSTAFDANPALVGNDLPQVPRNRGSFQIEYANPRYLNVAFGLQALGRQFDDDQNIRVVPGYTEPGLPEYALLSLTASRHVSRNLEVFAGVQNMLDQQYLRRHAADDDRQPAPRQRGRQDSVCSGQIADSYPPSAIVSAIRRFPLPAQRGEWTGGPRNEPTRCGAGQGCLLSGDVRG